jgi:hypothetical protein
MCEKLTYCLEFLVRRLIAGILICAESVYAVAGLRLLSYRGAVLWLVCDTLSLFLAPWPWVALGAHRSRSCLQPCL